MDNKHIVKTQMNIPVKQDLVKRIQQVHPDHDLELTEQGVILLEKFFRLENLVDQSCIMTCPGAESCTWARVGECPLAQAGAALPLGKICPIETIRFADVWQDLVLGVEDSDPHSFCSYLEKSLCKKVASFDIQIARVQKEISRNPSATINTQIPTREGVIESQDENPAYKTLKNLETMRASAFRQLNKAIENRHRVVKSRINNTDEQDRRDKLRAFRDDNDESIVEAEFQVKEDNKELDIFTRHKKATIKNKKRVITQVEKMKKLREESDDDE